MRLKALPYLLITGVLLISLMASGCTLPQASPAPTGTPVPGSPADAGIPEISDMSPVDTALESRPVFIEFGAPWCFWCELEKPVLEDLSAEYPGIAFYSVNADESPSLADDFYVQGIPAMYLVVKKNSDGSYLYIDPAGKTSSDRAKSMIRGYRTYDQLKPLMDAAVAAR